MLQRFTALVELLVLFGQESICSYDYYSGYDESLMWKPNLPLPSNGYGSNQHHSIGLEDYPEPIISNPQYYENYKGLPYFYPQSRIPHYVYSQSNDPNLPVQQTSEPNSPYQKSHLINKPFYIHPQPHTIPQVIFVNPPLYLNPFFRQRPGKSGTCSRQQTGCSDPYGDKSTFMTGCKFDVQCPPRYKCCWDNCFLQRVCKERVQPTAPKPLPCKKTLKLPLNDHQSPAIDDTPNTRKLTTLGKKTKNKSLIFDSSVESAPKVESHHLRSTTTEKLSTGDKYYNTTKESTSIGTTRRTRESSEMHVNDSVKKKDLLNIHSYSPNRRISKPITEVITNLASIVTSKETPDVFSQNGQQALSFRSDIEDVSTNLDVDPESRLETGSQIAEADPHVFQIENVLTTERLESAPSTMSDFTTNSIESIEKRESTLPTDGALVVTERIVMAPVAADLSSYLVDDFSSTDNDGSTVNTIWTDSSDNSNSGTTTATSTEYLGRIFQLYNTENGTTVEPIESTSIEITPDFITSIDGEIQRTVEEPTTSEGDERVLTNTNSSLYRILEIANGEGFETITPKPVGLNFNDFTSFTIIDDFVPSTKFLEDLEDNQEIEISPSLSPGSQTSENVEYIKNGDTTTSLESSGAEEDALLVSTTSNPSSYLIENGGKEKILLEITTDFNGTSASYEDSSTSKNKPYIRNSEKNALQESTGTEEEVPLISTTPNSPLLYIDDEEEKRVLQEISPVLSNPLTCDNKLREDGSTKICKKKIVQDSSSNNEDGLLVYPKANSHLYRSNEEKEINFAEGVTDVSDTLFVISENSNSTEAYDLTVSTISDYPSNSIKVITNNGKMETSQPGEDSSDNLTTGLYEETPEESNITIAYSEATTVDPKTESALSTFITLFPAVSTAKVESEDGTKAVYSTVSFEDIPTTKDILKMRIEVFPVSTKNLLTTENQVKHVEVTTTHLLIRYLYEGTTPPEADLLTISPPSKILPNSGIPTNKPISSFPSTAEDLSAIGVSAKKSTTTKVALSAVTKIVPSILCAYNFEEDVKMGNDQDSIVGNKRILMPQVITPEGTHQFLKSDIEPILCKCLLSNSKISTSQGSNSIGPDVEREVLIPQKDPQFLGDFAKLLRKQQSILEEFLNLIVLQEKQEEEQGGLVALIKDLHLLKYLVPQCMQTKENMAFVRLNPFRFFIKQQLWQRTSFLKKALDLLQ